MLRATFVPLLFAVTCHFRLWNFFITNSIWLCE